ncbi:DUF4390 domain-containing protein [Hydrogenophaga sp.]|uniref:DUF4390 domain-containing protein n=1 Tax=Hydrogenophaga sp. TaxID=1904254 RepID=UPI002619BBC7|nr:DUF4390 domain-containing protein [Hydrogenophaga sp.]MCW5655215.1 DUF4390 domain-containing protein [Hydrogenophaga sp.]
MLGRLRLAGLALLWLVFWPVQAQAPQLEQLSLLRTQEGLFLSARMELTPSPVVEDALLRAVPLYFVWHADVYRSRWYWTDKRVASATRTLRLAYQPLTRRWRVSLSNDPGAPAGGAGLQYALHQNFDSLTEALAGVARVARWRIASADRLEHDAAHQVEFAFRLDLSLLPRPFQIGMANQPEWAVELQRQLPVSETIEIEKPLAAPSSAEGLKSVDAGGGGANPNGTATDAPR